MAWTNFQVKVLKNLWKQGRTAKDIATFINEFCNDDIPITRNAVIVKIHRLGISGRATPPRPTYYGGGTIQNAYVFPARTEREIFDSQKIITPPCWRLRRFAEFFFSKKINKDVFGPTITDVQVEYADAVAANQHIKARWMHIRGYCSFFLILLSLLAASVIRNTNEIRKRLSGG